MDPGDLYRQGFTSFVPHPQVHPGIHHQLPPQQHQIHHYPPQNHHVPLQQARPISYPAVQRVPRKQSPQDEGDDSGSHPARIAHTLTACTRCRQRKTRCDPTLPRCLPCERSGSVCEYYDATKGKKIGRNYVVKLQEKVRQLEAELSEYIDEDNDYPRSNEDVVRPGGLVRLSDSDETPRYLGPSSGIAMSRLLMEQAKMFTDSRRISELFPEVRARRQTRMQSIVMANPKTRNKSYPTTSAHPAKALPARHVTDRLVEVFCQRSQVFWPTLHEKQFLQDLEDVFAGDTDSYKNFVVRLVFAISLQKLDIQYAGLADSYYLAAMEYFETVIRFKDLKTLQCLILICQYSLLTPTRMAIYYVVGLAVKICQAEGLMDEKTISAGYSMGLVDPLTLDLRRRLAHVVASFEFGLAHSMGRPNGLAKGDDFWDVEPFATVDDEHITEEGIMNGPVSEKKLVAIHFFKMRQLQAEIKRCLYEKKRPEPKNETHPWFAEMERRIQEWADQSPENPAWCKPWFTGRAHQMRIFLHRPCPQIPRPSSRAASICFEGSAYILNLSKQQMEKAAVDITWVFLLNLFMALNTLLWTISFAEIRQKHSKEEVDELVQTALDIVEQEQCSERWPGAQAASNLYSVFAKAILQVYDAKDPSTVASSHLSTPPSIFDGNSPGSEQSNSTASYKPNNAPQFGTVFNATPESMTNYGYDASFPQHQPTFRSNSIFANPSSDTPGRRFSAYAPESPLDDSTPPAAGPQTAPYPTSISPPAQHHQNHMATPPDSMATNPINAGTPGSVASRLSPASSATPTMSHASPALSYVASSTGPVSTNMSPPPPPKTVTYAQHQHPQSGAMYGPPVTPQQQRHLQQQQPVQQRPLPQADSVGDWFSPPPMMSQQAFNPMGNNFFGGPYQATGYVQAGPAPAAGGMAGAGVDMGQLGFGPFSGGQQQVNWNAQRQGSLSQEQQLELMNALETDGVGEIDAFLNMGMDGLAPNGAAW